MHQPLLLCLALITSVSFLVLVSQKLRLAYPIFLVLAGLIIGFVPQVPAIHIDPELVFLVILPPVLFDAAQNTSWKAMWKWRRIITVLAFGFVLLTAVAVAFVSTWLIPGFTLAQGFLLGAIISPPDAAAATAVLQYVRLPKSMVSILEGESLLNDASSLTLFRFALAAILTSQFTWYEAAGGFALVVVSGIGIGLLFGVLFYAIYKWLPTTSNLNIALSLVLPYLMYLTAESVDSSGVLAVVSGGLFIAYQNHFVFSHSSRLKANAIWPSVVFILNAVVFFLIGLQLPDIIKGLKGISVINAAGIALIITAVVIIVRMAAAQLSGMFTVFISRYITVAQSRPGWRNPVILGWAGMRGVVSLASALSIPLLLPGGKAFPNRDLILFVTFVVIIVTLVVQGLLLPWVIRTVKPEQLGDLKSDEQQIAEIEFQLLTQAINRIRKQHKNDIDTNRLLQNKHELLQYKLSLYKEAQHDEEKLKHLLDRFDHFRDVMMQVIEHERDALHAFRKKEGYDDDIIRVIENRLDLEEERLEEDSDW